MLSRAMAKVVVALIVQSFAVIHTFGGTILQIPCGSASALILEMYSSGPKANSSGVG